MKEEKNEIGYHGEYMQAPYFEGWYFKVVTSEFALALIVGISKNKKDEHAFIQTIDTLRKTTQYERFSMDDVAIHENPWSIMIQEHVFSKQFVHVHLGYLHIEIHQYEFSDLKSSYYAPTIMGPFSYMKHMQCVHSIISLRHYVRGTAWIDRSISDPRHRLYGKRPRCIVSITISMGASKRNAVLFFLSIAHIPMALHSFTGCICVLMIKEKQYRFTTYDGVRIVKNRSFAYADYDRVWIELKQFAYRLVIEIDDRHAYPLIAPQDGIMEPKVMESLDSSIHVQLFRHHQLLYEETFHHAGCEIRS